MPGSTCTPIAIGLDARELAEALWGGVLMVDGGVTKTWSSMQATVAQSSGEAEDYAMIQAAAEALGMQSVMRDLGWEARIRLWVDSSAAKSMASRIGIGRVRHMEVKFLWLQEAVKNRGIEVRKVPGTLNPADVLTKPKPVKEVAELLEGVGVYIKSRREDGHGPLGDVRPYSCEALQVCNHGSAGAAWRLLRGHGDPYHEGSQKVLDHKRHAEPRNSSRTGMQYRGLEAPRTVAGQVGGRVRGDWGVRIESR